MKADTANAAEQIGIEHAYIVLRQISAAAIDQMLNEISDCTI